MHPDPSDPERAIDSRGVHESREAPRNLAPSASTRGSESVDAVPGKAGILKESPHAPAAVRARVTFALLWINIGIVAAMLLLIAFDEFTGKDWTRFKDIFPLVLSPFVTLLSMALGFYFAILVEREQG